MWSVSQFLLPKIIDYYKSKHKAKVEETEKEATESKQFLSKCKQRINELEQQIQAITLEATERNRQLTTHLIQISVHSELILTLFKDDLDNKPEGYRLAIEKALESIRKFKEDIENDS